MPAVRNGRSPPLAHSSPVFPGPGNGGPRAGRFSKPLALMIRRMNDAGPNAAARPSPSRMTKKKSMNSGSRSSSGAGPARTACKPSTAPACPCRPSPVATSVRRSNRLKSTPWAAASWRLSLYSRPALGSATWTTPKPRAGRAAKGFLFVKGYGGDGSRDAEALFQSQEASRNTLWRKGCSRRARLTA